MDKWKSYLLTNCFHPFFIIISDIWKKNSLRFFSEQKEFSLDELHENTLFSIKGYFHVQAKMEFDKMKHFIICPAWKNWDVE